MKLDPVFYVKESKLYSISDNTEFSTDKLKKVEINWSTVELEDEQYNEEFLAELRNSLKEMEEKNEFAVLVPVTDKDISSPEKVELFINAFNHTARRVKDCESVAGMELPLALIDAGIENVQLFIETLGKKHAQYVYFAKSDNASHIQDNNLLNSIVLY